MKRPLTIRVYEDAEGLARVRVTAGNHRILLSSEAYEGGPDGARHAVAVLVANIRDGNYVIDTGDEPPRRRRWRRRA